MGLRESLDEGAGEIGDGIGEEIPSTPTELRDELPADVDALELAVDDAGSTDDQARTNGGTSDDLSIDVVVEDTPLDRFL